MAGAALMMWINPSWLDRIHGKSEFSLSSECASRKAAHQVGRAHLFSKILYVTAWPSVAYMYETIFFFFMDDGVLFLCFKIKGELSPKLR